MPINDNSININQYKGLVEPCPLCYRHTPDAALDALMSGKSCRLCFGKTFIAHCLNCHSTGLFTGGSVWDGGRSQHTSTCGPCGGNGVFPAPKPADWDTTGKEKYDAMVTTRNAAVCTCTHSFDTHANPKRDPKDIKLWVTGRCKGKIGTIMCQCEAFTTPITDDVSNVVESTAVAVS